MLTFNNENMITPNFPFRVPIMEYIFENVQPQHLIKLYQCSKYFYNKFRRNIILNLEIVDDDGEEIFDPIKTIIHEENTALQKLKNVWISDSLIHKSLFPFFMVPFNYCKIKKLELWGHILWKDFKCLTKAGTIKELKIKGVMCETGFASIDEIISEVPNAKSIDIGLSYFTGNTCSTLLSLNHKAKLSNLVFKNIIPYSDFKSELFQDFVIKNAGDKCNVEINYKLFPELSDQHRELNETLVQSGQEVCFLIAAKLDVKRIERML